MVTMPTKFYVFADGTLIDVADRGTSKKAIIELQKQEWVRKHGGIVGVREYTEPHAVFFATRPR